MESFILKQRRLELLSVVREWIEERQPRNAEHLLELIERRRQELAARN